MRHFYIALVALALAGPAFARAPSTKTVIQPSSGSRADITVPYTTNGLSTLGVWNFVGPRIYSVPALDARGTPNGSQVYNLQYYGSKIMTGSGVIGAGPAQPNILRRR